ncbi:uncharacterized protein PV09_01697 [Verruconis gallopava]|uniref:Transcription initiation factor TFIID subunit 2 n=1 Tax=Verruconis gallopava TaxID=253628 RepID=A0A0D1XY77_9PEZI|nr:uncharacterized protein PV09_01697 [Verruconis gallopava]KIW07771.1 hypothetical protein PV09_01697 [Verruconis gallopava]
MPVTVDEVGVQAQQPQQESSEALYTVTQQEVELDIDFKSRVLIGRTSIIIEPQSKELTSVSLTCRSLKVTKVFVDGHPVKLPTYRDPYDGLNVRDGYTVHQHHQMRENIEDAVKEQPDPNLSIQFPKQIKVNTLNANEITSAHSAALDAVLESALANNLEEGDTMFVPITIVVEYTIENSRDSLQWIGLRDGDSRYPHVYTCASSLPGSLPCFVFPYLGSPSSKYSWRLSVCCPRTLGDLFWKPQRTKGDPRTNGANGHDQTMNINANEDEFARGLTNEERNRDIIVVGSGLLEDNDAPCKFSERRRKWVFQCSVPVAPVHIGFAIGPFEEVDFSEFRESGKEDQLKDHAVGVRGYCMPGRADELRNTCLPLQMAIDSFMQSYISYPFAPECQTYKMCFVDDLAQDVIDTATLSLCSSRLLYPETILDSVWENSRILIRAAASQWIGVFITPKASSDYWIIVGASYFMAENFMAGLWGRNELRYRQKLAADAVKDKDKHMPSIYECGNAVSLDPAELDFLELKAPLILYLLHQRLVKQSSAVGVVRILTRMLSDARSGRLGSNEIWTDRFIYTTEKVAHAKVQSFFDQWVYGSGVPSFLVSQAFQKKKFSVAITIKQTQKLDVLALQPQPLSAGNFFREVKEMEHEIYAGQLQDSFTGPMTIRVHEPSGLPYEQIVEVRDGETKVEFHYNSKNKNQLRKRRQRLKEAAVEGHAHVAEDGDDYVPTYSLGDVLMKPEEAAEWQLETLSEDQENILANASYEWIRVDKDFEWIANISFHPGGTPGELELMYIMQLQGDNDVVAHLEAIQRLMALTPSRLLSSVFLRTLMDSRYFYGVRVKAAEALVGCAISQLDYIGFFHLEKAFKTLFCYEGNAGMTKPNDFSDLRLYRIRCAIVQAMSVIRDDRGKAPKRVKQFFLDTLKFNDNSSNQYSDSYYVAYLISGLTRALSSSYNSFQFQMDTDLAEQAAEARLKREALGEIERMRRIDEWIPSYRNVHTRAALRGLVDLMLLRIIPKRTASFLPYTRPGNHDEVRLEAFDHLISLGMMANDSFIRYIFSSLANEPSSYFRDRLWRRIHRGLASIALGETKIDRQQDGDADMNGFTIDTGETMLASRNEAMERSTLEGALKWMAVQLEQNKTLERAIMDALRSPIIGLKDFSELLDLCAHLYKTKDYLPVTLHYPRYWRIQNLGDGKIRFYRSDKFRFKPQNIRPDLKRKKTSDERSESPDAKRRKSGLPLKISLGRSNPTPIPTTPALQAPPVLPSPGSSQSAITAIPKQIQPSQNESPAPHAPIKSTSPVSVKKKPSPAVVKKVSASSANSWVSPAPKLATKSVLKQKRVVLKFKNKKKEYASIVKGTTLEKSSAVPKVPPYADDDDDDDDEPLASRASALPQTNGTTHMKMETAPPPPPLSSIPAPNTETPSSRPSDIPPPQQKLKLKLKFGGGGK